MGKVKPSFRNQPKMKIAGRAILVIVVVFVICLMPHLSKAAGPWEVITSCKRALGFETPLYTDRELIESPWLSPFWSDLEYWYYKKTAKKSFVIEGRLNARLNTDPEDVMRFEKLGFATTNSEQRKKVRIPGTFKDYYSAYLTTVKKQVEEGLRDSDKIIYIGIEFYNQVTKESKWVRLGKDPMPQGADWKTVIYDAGSLVQIQAHTEWEQGIVFEQMVRFDPPFLNHLLLGHMVEYIDPELNDAQFDLYKESIERNSELGLIPRIRRLSKGQAFRYSDITEAHAYLIRVFYALEAGVLLRSDSLTTTIEQLGALLESHKLDKTLMREPSVEKIKNDLEALGIDQIKSLADQLVGTLAPKFQYFGGAFTDTTNRYGLEDDFLGSTEGANAFIDHVLLKNGEINTPNYIQTIMVHGPEGWLHSINAMLKDWNLRRVDYRSDLILATSYLLNFALQHQFGAPRPVDIVRGITHGPLEPGTEVYEFFERAYPEGPIVREALLGNYEI